MKSIYNSVRNILYPQSRFPRAGVHFAAGTHPYAKDNRYPPHLCQALMNFEQRNRGHRHLLAAPTLRVDSRATAVEYNYDKRNLVKVRRVMRNSLRDLFRSVLALERESPEGDFQGLLDSNDRQGYMPSIVFDEIKFACKAAHLTWLPAWLEVTAVRVETGEDAVVHLRLTRTWDNVSAKRSVPLVQLDRVSLREAKVFYNDSVHRVREALKDAALWPEFAAPEVVPSSVSSHSPEELTRINELAGRLVEGDFQRSQEPAETWSFSETAGRAESPSGPDKAPGSIVHVELTNFLPAPVAAATAEGMSLVSAKDQELLAHLKRQMQDFVGMYSRDAQTMLAANWEQFRPDVPKQ
jgi:hypothetical protein